MRKRQTAEYHEPETLGDLRRIVADHADLSDETRIWFRHESRILAVPNEIFYVVSVSSPISAPNTD